MTAQLSDVLTDVRQRIERHRGTAAANEQNTKAALIEPVLRALGWDPEDLDEVQREYRRKGKDKPVDYALFVLRRPKLFIEAKALDQNLDDRRWTNQVVGYAAVGGVEWVVLTNGDEYRVFNSHAAVAVDEKLFRQFRVSDESSRAAENLVLLSKKQLNGNRLEELWKAHFVDRQVRSAIEGLFVPETDLSFVRLLRKHTASLSPGEIRDSLGRARVHLDFPMEAIPPHGPPPGTPPDKSKRPPLVSVRELIEAGLIRPRLRLKKVYKGRPLTAEIRADGTITVGGKAYKSLSAAAVAAVAGAFGTKVAADGWVFWSFKSQDGALTPIDHLRRQYRQKRK